MKKIKLILSVVVAAFIFSCEDATDIKQPGVLDASAAIQSVSDMSDALNSAYNSMDVALDIHHSAVFTDEIRIGFDNGGQGQSLYRFNLNNGSAGPSNLWLGSYSGIRRANLVIEAAGVVDATGQEALRDDILGQAYAIRAWHHLKLASYLIVDMSDDSSLGVPIVDFVTSTDYQATRNTTGETFQFIYDDLDQAISLISSTSGSIYFSKDAARALKARAAAYREDYGTATPLAQSLLNSYPLANQASYTNVFADTSNDEVIMKLERTVNDSYDGQGQTGASANGGWAGAKFAFTGPDLSGSPYYEVATNLWNAFDPSDIRRSVNAVEFPTPNAAGRVVYTVNKYRGSEGQPLMNDHKILRSSEMALILAEARADANDPAGAAGFVGQVRTARFGSAQTVTYGNAAEAWGGIIDERRLEFAFEGSRYLDLRRLGAKGNRTVDRASQDCDPFGACTIPVTDFRFTYPIPFGEFNANPALREEQNPGY
ncbi:putative outer membrane protein [Nonlabens tegetincola]|uniref:Putative outer membrane protein n=1 Tax=Nonlabens tegetincola TaxID=323273 RepID=A0A090QP68_9FLAO|nr:RagB/SusD family nutrient uptake outer membrane protein [Nonlabens tegetincola]GAK97301.1 putative outer membrane protein [Nonlabens tegetincola]